MNPMPNIAELAMSEELTSEQVLALESLAEEESAQELKREKLREDLGQVLVKRRDIAVRYRSTSGIEQQWAEDQAYYEGFDDTSRSRFYKGMTVDSPLISRDAGSRGGSFKSKVFLNITRPYVETAASKVIEVLSPTDDRSFSVEMAPIPFAVMQGRVVEGRPVVFPLVEPQATASAPAPQDLVSMSGGAADAAQVAQEQTYKRDMEKLRFAAKGAQTWIDDKLQACGYNEQLRALVDESARLGTGAMRGPTATIRRHTKTEGQATVIVEEIAPSSKNISIWNCYPDPACGDNIHNGQFFVEHDMMVERQVRELIGLPGYLEDALLKVIDDGPKRSALMEVALAPHDSTDMDAKRFDVWYYYGVLSVEDVVAMRCDCTGMQGGVPAVVTMINDTPVKANLAPLDSGRFPYDFMCWQKTAGSPYGIGIARQIRSCQAILNANVRAMNENAGLCSGPQIILGRGSIAPADGKWEITPRKIWVLLPDADIQDVNKAFNSLVIPSMQGELLQSVDFALKMAENVTGLPILLQGQAGPTGVPETVGGMQILVANASSLLRRMARIFDDSITKPHVTRYYQWLMENTSEDAIKGDFLIVPRGASALVAKDMRSTFLTQAVPQMIANPAFGIDPARYFKEVAKLNGLDAIDVQFTEAEMKALLAQPQPLDPKVEVAQIAADARVESTTINARTNLARIARDTDRDTAYVMAENERTVVTSKTKMAELELRRELAMLEFANKHELTIEQIKAKLALEGGKMDLQRELAVMGRIEASDVTAGENQVLTPPVEPPGRAPDGQSFAM